MKKITLLFLLLTLPLIGYSQDVAYNFDSNGDTEGWQQSGTTNVALGGFMNVAINSPTQGWQLTRTPGSLNLLESEYLTLRIVVKNNVLAADGTTPWTAFHIVNFDTGSTNVTNAVKVDFTIPEGAGYQTIDIPIPTNPDNSGTIDQLAIRFKAGANTLFANSNLDFDSITLIYTETIPSTYNGFVQNPDFEDETAGLNKWSIETATGTTLSFTNTPADVQNGSQAAKITYDRTLLNSSIKVWNNYTYVFSSPIPETYSVQLSRFQKSADVSTDVQVVLRMHKTGGGNKDFYQGFKTSTISYKEEVDDRVLDDGNVADVTYDSMEIFFRFIGGTIGSEVFIDNITTSILAPTVTWTGLDGTNDTDWNADDNWDDVSPGLNPIVNISIPTGIPSYPVLTTGQELKQAFFTSLTVDSGASLTINSNVIFTNDGTITNNGTVTFKSDATGSAYIGEGSGTFTGDFTVERYIPAKRAYRLLSTPVTTTDEIDANWQLGTHITGLLGATNGFDPTTTDDPSMFTFKNDAPQAWETVTSTTATNLSAGIPYRIMVRGDRTIDLSDNGSTATVTTLSSTGPLTFEGGDATSTVYYTGVADNDFNLIGNPYQAPVNMNTVLATNTAVNPDFYWIWDPVIGGDNGRGGYVAVDLSDDGTSSIGAGNQYLQPGQAAFVQTETGGGSIMITQNSKNSSVGETATFKAVSKKASTSKLRLSLYENSALLENQSASDGLLILFDNSYSNEVNYRDAAKLTNLDENFATSNGGKLLSIEKREIPTVSDEIALSINQYRSTDYTIVAEGTSLTGETAFLFDAYTNEYTEIPQNGSVNYAYSIDINIPASTTADRFSVKFSSQSLSLADSEIQKIHLYPNPVSGGSIYLHVPQNMDDLEVTIYNVIGAKLFSKSGFRAGSKATINTEFAKEHGLYFVKVSSKGNTTTKKLIIN